MPTLIHSLFVSHDTLHGKNHALFDLWFGRKVIWLFLGTLPMVLIAHDNMLVSVTMNSARFLPAVNISTSLYAINEDVYR